MIFLKREQKKSKKRPSLSLSSKKEEINGTAFSRHTCDRGLPESFVRRVPSPFEHALTRRRTREGASRRRGAVLGVKGLRTCRRRTWRTRGRFRELRGRRSPWRPTQTGGARHSRGHHQVLAERDPADLPGLQAGVPERPGWRGCLQADLFAVLSAGR